MTLLDAHGLVALLADEPGAGGVGDAPAVGADEHLHGAEVMDVVARRYGVPAADPSVGR